jgi:hypothetical protein
MSEQHIDNDLIGGNFARRFAFESASFRVSASAKQSSDNRGVTL